MNWSKLERCKACGRHPLVIPVGRGKREILCDHGGEMPASEKYATTEEWNSNQIEDDTTSPDYRGCHKEPNA
jgi:hypothetical protein